MEQMQAQTGNVQTPFSPITYFWVSINPGALMITTLYPDMGNALESLVGISLPIWIVYLIFYLLITVICLFIATRKLRANMKTNR